LHELLSFLLGVYTVLELHEVRFLVLDVHMKFLELSLVVSDGHLMFALQQVNRLFVQLIGLRQHGLVSRPELGRLILVHLVGL